MFLGHINELGDKDSKRWKTVEYDKSRIVVNNKGNYSIRSNVCPHQHSLIKTTVMGDNIASVCPYHGWSWDEDGNPKGNGTVGHAPHSSQCKNTQPLKDDPIYLWNGFMFTAGVGFYDLDISGNYKIDANIVPIMDLFLDVDHIPVVHPKVYDKIDIPRVDHVQWRTSYMSSAQIVKDTKGKLGALWVALYQSPNVMFEWQPGAVFVMVNEQITDSVTQCHIYKYKDINKPNKLWKLNEEVWEEAWQQDREQAELLEPHWRTTPTENLDDEKQRYRYLTNRSKQKETGMVLS